MRNRHGQTIRQIVDGIALVKSGSCCDYHSKTFLLNGVHGSRVVWYCPDCASFQK